MCAFSALGRIFEILMLIGSCMVNTSKTQHIVVNRMWQLTFSHQMSLEVRSKHKETLSIFKNHVPAYFQYVFACRPINLTSPHID